MKNKTIITITILIVIVSIVLIIDLTSKITLTEYWNNPLAGAREYNQARVEIKYNTATIYYDGRKACVKKLNTNEVKEIKEHMKEGYRNNNYNAGDVYKIYLAEYRFNRTYIDSKDDNTGLLEELFICYEY